MTWATPTILKVSPSRLRSAHAFVIPRIFAAEMRGICSFSRRHPDRSRRFDGEVEGLAFDLSS